MLMADTVMDADEPRFQIGEDEMDDRQIVLGNLWVEPHSGNGKVFIPALAEAGISTPIVSDGQRPRSNGALHEPTKRVGAPIGYYGEPDTPGIASVLSLVLRGSRFPMTNLDGTSDREPCGGHPGLRRESVHQPMSRLSQHVPPACRRYDPDWAAPCQRGACGECRRPSHSATGQAVAETEPPRCRASGWRPNKPPKTMCSTAYGCVP